MEGKGMMAKVLKVRELKEVGKEVELKQVEVKKMEVQEVKEVKGVKRKGRKGMEGKVVVVVGGGGGIHVGGGGAREAGSGRQRGFPSQGGQWRRRRRSRTVEMRSQERSTSTMGHKRVLMDRGVREGTRQGNGREVVVGEHVEVVEHVGVEVVGLVGSEGVGLVHLSQGCRWCLGWTMCNQYMTCHCMCWRCQVMATACSMPSRGHG
jgi:hypothetical protein